MITSQEKTASSPQPDPDGGPRLVAIWDGGQASCALPPSGELLLGRSLEADLQIDAPSVSREHALVRAGNPPAILDLQSSNGTSVGGRPLAPGQAAPLLPGCVAQLGTAFLILKSSPLASSLLPATPSVRALAPSAQLAMDELYRLVELVARGTLSVILQGETGVGKEVLARRIHERSPRAKQPFLKLNCAAFAESMAEAELFGHERGAFTGALHAKPGLLESAHGGTVLLDEVGELSLPLQAKLLRALGNAEVLRVGSLVPRAIDVRFIAATNRDFGELIARGAFRSDLYFRLNGISLTIPPLRERRAEISALSRQFLEHFAAELGVSPPTLSAQAHAWLSSYAFPGNIRELQNMLERAILLARGGSIELEHLRADPVFLARSQPDLRAPGSPANDVPQLADAERLERERIAQAIAECGGNQKRAAEVLGMSRRALLRRLDSYALPRPRKGS